VGTTVFGGMIAATTLNLLFIPVLYVIVRSVVKGKLPMTAASGLGREELGHEAD
jgi:hypothetical protein